MVINNGYTGNVNRINNINGINGISNIRPSTNVSKPVQNAVNGSQAAGSFENILKDTVNQNNGLKFSKHAELRLQARNINLTQSQKDKMNEAVSKAESKGVRDSLVLMDNLAFVVNIRNKTVITAVNSSELKDNVFTNIDGAVIV